MSRALNVIVFPGGFNLPIWAGVHSGAFARHDVEIRLHFTTNSMQQLAGLVRGAWEIGLTGFDNVIVYQEGEGEADPEGLQGQRSEVDLRLHGGGG